MTAPAPPSHTAAYAPPQGGVRCANCDAALVGEYCASCGQKAADLDPTVRELVRETWEELTSVDGKLLRTLRALIVRPGLLTAEYIAGRRAPYVAPLKLYLWLSVLYFFLNAALPHHGERREVTVTGSSGADTVVSAAALDSAARAAAADTSRALVERRLGSALRRAAAHEDEFVANLAAWVPRAVFVLVPLFALLLSRVYRSRGMRYPRHLAFAFHLHGFVFILLLAGRLAEALRVGPAAETAAAAAILFVVPVYAGVAMQRVYGGRVGATAARVALLAALYLPLFLIAMGFAMVVALLTF